MYNILIIDDEFIIRRGIKTFTNFKKMNDLILLKKSFFDLIIISVSLIFTTINIYTKNPKMI